MNKSKKKIAQAAYGFPTTMTEIDIVARLFTRLFTLYSHLSQQ